MHQPAQRRTFAPIEIAHRPQLARMARLRLHGLAAALLASGLLAAAPAQAAGPVSAYTLTRIGLTGAEYTGADGWQSTYVSAMNAAGQVAGTSKVLSMSYGSEDAWVYSGGTTQRIGLTDAGYVNPVNGGRNSWVVGLNATGQVVGETYRYTSATEWDMQAWLYSGGTSQRLGPTGAGYEQAGTGRSASLVVGINSAGQAAGSADIYSGVGQVGKTAWFYSGGNTLDIGLGGAGFTQPGTGYRYSVALALNEMGQVAGSSTRFNSTIGAGNATWLYNNGTTQIIGLYDAEHTLSNRSLHSSIQGLNNTGQVVGVAPRSEAFGGGYSAWLFDGSSSQTIGLQEAANTRGDGFQSSHAAAINDAGQVAGSSERFNGLISEGWQAWLYGAGTTKTIGLTGANYQSNAVSFLNAAGQVGGSAYRRLPGQVIGSHIAWVYDDDLDQSFELLFTQSHDGDAGSSIEYLGDDGLAVGQYDHFFGNTYLGTRAFAWTVQGGMVDLGSVVDGGLSMDWMSLALAYRANGAGQIAGLGALANGSQGAFLMTPVPTPVPEPEGYALLLAGLGVLRLAGRRQRPATATATVTATLVSA